MRLMFILASVISGFLTLTPVFFQATRKIYLGFDRWTARVGLLKLAYLLMRPRELIADSISILKPLPLADAFPGVAKTLFDDKEPATELAKRLLESCGH